MKELFLPDTGQVTEKTAELEGHYLSAEPQNWVKEIITIFLQEYPYLQDESITITWTKRDDKKGYAVGSLNVISATIPIIIKEYKMSPLDILMLPEITLPLNHYFLQQIYQKPEAFKGLDDGKRNPYQSLFGSQNSLQFSPTSEYSGGSEGSRVVRDAVKVASILDTLSYVNPDDAKDLLSELRDESVFRAYEDNNNLSAFNKIAEIAKKSKASSALEDAIRSLDIDRQMTYEDEYGNKFVKQANSKVNKTWTTKINTLEASEQEDLIANTKVAQKMEKTAASTVYTPASMGGGISDLKNNYFSVFTSDSEERPILDEFFVTSVEKVAEMPKTANFSLNGGNKMLIIGENGQFAIKTGSFDANQKDVEKYSAWTEGSNPKVGDYGTFIVEKKATEPFEITRMQKVAGVGNFIIEGESGLEKVSYYPINVKSSIFAPHDKEKNAFYVPGNARFVKLAGKNDKLAELKNFEAKIKIEGLCGFQKTALYLTDSSEESMYSEVYPEGVALHINNAVFCKKAQYAEETSGFTTEHRVYRDTHGLYALVGPEFEKYAESSPTRNLSLNEAKWSSLHCGATAEDLEKLAALKEGHSLEISGEIKSPESVERVVEKFNSKYASLSDFKTKLTKNLVKQAASLKDKNTVDAVLALGLLRKRNIHEYIAALPQFEAALTSMAKLLVGARMGLSGISADTAKETMDALAQTVIELQGLQGAMSKIK